MKTEWEFKPQGDSPQFMVMHTLCGTKHQREKFPENGSSYFLI